MSEQEPQQLITTSPAPEREGSEPGRGRARTLGPGDAIGRYLVLARLGAGGMGVVYAAYDPELDRKVAIKLLHPARAGGSRGDDAEARLQREAQAIAQLSHPNVIAVFDVGTLDEQVFFAMEFVEGPTLREWQRAHRPWAELRDAYVAAGRGLAAAHGAGLQHRDFKPDNVLVGRDGRVRVLDFGLARAGEEETPAQTRTGAVRALAELGPGDGEGRRDDGDDAGATTRLLSLQLTRDGAVLGTPAYMAPEQHLGGKTDARADQFSFCVALYEALYGERPFAGNSPAQLAMAVLDGRVRAEPGGARVPAWLRRVLLRGLAVEPDHRWPDMPALLDHLARAPGRRRTRLGLAGFAVAATLAVAWGQWRDGRAGQRLCEPVEDPLAGIWDASRRTQVREAFAATEAAYADDVWATVSVALDDYTGEYLRQRRDACEASVIRREQSMDLMQRRHQCLARRLGDVRALTDLFARADARAVQNAAQAAGSLPPLAHCADVDALLTSLDPPLEGELARQVEAIDAELARVKALRKLGQLEQARPLAEDALARADAVDHRSSQARARHELGVLLRDAGEFEAARTTLLEAARTAARAQQDRDAAQSLALAVHVAGRELNRGPEALEWASWAQALLERHGDDPGVRADLETGLGAVDYQAGRMGPAREHFEQALALRRAHDPPDPERVAASLNNLASVAFSEGEWDQALARFEEVLALRERQLGPRHPELAGLMQNVGAALTRKLELEPALERFRQAAELQKAAFGADHPNYAAMLSNTGVVLSRLGRHAEAEQAEREALAIRTATFGPEHDSVAASRTNLGGVLSARGDDEGALAELERAVTVYRAAFGAEHPRLASAIETQARIRLRLGDHAGAASGFEEAQRIRAAVHGEDDARTQLATAWRLAVDVDREPTSERLARLEAALAGLDTVEDLGSLRFRLARGRWATGEHARAVAEAGQAANELRAVHAGRDLHEVEAWLAARPRAR